MGITSHLKNVIVKMAFGKAVCLLLAFSAVALGAPEQKEQPLKEEEAKGEAKGWGWGAHVAPVVAPVAHAVAPVAHAVAPVAGFAHGYAGFAHGYAGFAHGYGYAHPYYGHAGYGHY